MKIRIFILLTIMLCCSAAKEENSDPKTNKVYESFQIIENKMQAHYDYIEKKGIFEDPLGRIDYFFKTVKTVAPQLLTDTKLYKDDLLNLLTNKTFQKKHFTNEGIVFVLYNLPIDDYVDVLDSALSLYQNEKINQSIFELFIFQNEIASVSVAKNFKKEKLQVFLNKLLDDQSLIRKVELQNKHFRKSILNLKSGLDWEGTSNGGLKKLTEIQPAVLDTLKVGL
ncbi:hypothetical protein [Bacteroides graminisolvens]|uniref:hypothetical protein n=1 Tax=Bacteroides graminisolvens TaxID=477666 RepID=UPI00240A8DAB|nr:hypothetical protein [Bacteroides graminisolvens]